MPRRIALQPTITARPSHVGRPRPQGRRIPQRAATALLTLRTRWSVEILAHIARGGVRFVQLLHQFHMSRDGLRATLDELLAAGLIMRNPGYGHPLRPEYVLTDCGRPVAAACAHIVARLGRTGREPLHRRRWALQALAAMTRATWFNDVKAELPGVTSRALTTVLRSLASEGLILRRIEPTSPPRVGYHLTPAGKRLAALLA
jgi:DNA-binding HxlR family transcriptional regulator